MNGWVAKAAFVVLLSGVGFAVSPASAADGTDEALLNCANEKDDARRLRCFDAVAAGLRRVPATAAAKLEGKFGARGDLNPEKREELSEITAKVTEVSTRPHGELVVTLDNGQVWVERTASSKIKVKAGDTVKIESGALGSFVLIAPNGRSSKVARVH
jgi:hypothetical protein